MTQGEDRIMAGTTLGAPRAVNLKTATAMLGLKDTRVTRRLAESGAIVGKRAGNRWCISIRSIEHWLEGTGRR